MKYIKSYESNINVSLIKLLSDHISKILPNDIKLVRHFREHWEPKNSEKFALQAFDKRSNPAYKIYFNILKIYISQVRDKKLKDEKVKSKLKIMLMYDEDNVTHVSNAAFIDDLVSFLKEIFEKYSYFNDKCYYPKRNDYYINISKIDNIMTDLKDFEIWANSKKYNL